ADRLARDLLVSEVILGQFRKLGVKVVAADGGAELTSGGGDDDPTRVLIRQGLGAVAQFGKGVLVLKLRAARERMRRRRGRCEGRKPFGANPSEQATLGRILELRRATRGRPRMSFEAIADQLNAENVPTRQGQPWRPGSVYAVVKRVSPRLC